MHKGEKMHYSSDFQIENKIKNLVTYIDKYIICTIPKVHCSLKIHLEDECYNLVRFLYEAVWTKGNIRVKNITEILVVISLIDHLLEQVKNLNCVTNKKIDSALSLLTDIKILVQGWKKSTDNEKGN